MPNYTWIVAIGLIGLSTVASAGKPVFDCKKAQGEVEKLICNDSGLAALDHEMQRVFETALPALPFDDAKLQKAIQRGWIKGRNDCWKANDVRKCTEFAYKSRIAELQIISGQLEVSQPVSLDCQDNKEPVTAVFYNQTDPASMVLTWGNQQQITLAKPTASGSKYLGQNVRFMEHQGEITITWQDRKLLCRTRQ